MPRAVEREVEDDAAEEDAVDGEGGEAVLADPAHEPVDDGDRDDEAVGGADRDEDPLVRRDVEGAEEFGGLAGLGHWSGGRLLGPVETLLLLLLPVAVVLLAAAVARWTVLKALRETL